MCVFQPTMLQWIELLTKQFNNSQAACEVGPSVSWFCSCVFEPFCGFDCFCLFQWFLDQMADDNWWPMQILIKCPNQIVRQVTFLFQSEPSNSSSIIMTGLMKLYR